VTPGRFVLRAVVAGLIGTTTMALVGGLGRALGVLGGVEPALFARWVGNVLRGRVAHDDIATAPDVAIAPAAAIGVHYAIGVVLAAAWLALVLRARRRLGPAHAVLYGVATSVFAWFLMFPAMGYGVLGLDGPPGALLLRTSLVNHVAYGLALATTLHVWPAVRSTRAATPGYPAAAGAGDVERAADGPRRSRA
jgi:hypothetical protein